MKPRNVVIVKYTYGVFLLVVFLSNSYHAISAIEQSYFCNVNAKSGHESFNNQADYPVTLSEADSVFLSVGSADSSLRIIGLSMNYTASESGYGPGLDMKISIEKENRLLGAGIVMQHRSAKVYGGEIFYRHYLSSLYTRDDSGYEQHRTFRFYLQYNFFFRKKNLQETYEETQWPENSTEPEGRAATFEHYAGGGAQAIIIGNFFMNAAIGYGIILGSAEGKYIDEPHYTMGGRKNDHGLLVKFGTGYFFGK